MTTSPDHRMLDAAVKADTLIQSLPWLLRFAGRIVVVKFGGKPVAKANIAEKGKTQKAIIRDYLTGTNGRAKVEGWLPGWMEFPFRALGAKSKRPKADMAAIAAE